MRLIPLRQKAAWLFVTALTNALVSVVAIASTTDSATNIDRQRFAAGADIQLQGQHPIYRLEIPTAVYWQSVAPSLPDVLLLNGAGQVVPQLLRQPPAQRSQTEQLSEVSIFPLVSSNNDKEADWSVQVSAGANGQIINIANQPTSTTKATSWLLDLSQLKHPASRLLFDWDARQVADGGIWHLQISSSDDLRHWHTVATQGSLAQLTFNGQKLRQADIHIKQKAGKYLQVRSVNKPLPHFRKISVSHQHTQQQQVSYHWLIPAEHPQLKQQQNTINGQQQLAYQLPVAMPIQQARLNLQQTNSIAQIQLQRANGRQWPVPYWQMVKEVHLWQLNSEQGQLARPRQQLSFPASNAIALTTPAQQNAAIQLELGWPKQELLFFAQGNGPFQLVWGNVDYLLQDANQPLGHREGTAIKTLLQSSGIAQLVGTAISATPTALGGEQRLKPPEPAKDYSQWWLWGALGLAMMVLAGLAWLLIKELKNSK